MTLRACTIGALGLLTVVSAACGSRAVPPADGGETSGNAGAGGASNGGTTGGSSAGAGATGTGGVAGTGGGTAGSGSAGTGVAGSGGAGSSGSGGGAGAAGTTGGGGRGGATGVAGRGGGGGAAGAAGSAGQGGSSGAAGGAGGSAAGSGGAGGAAGRGGAGGAAGRGGADGAAGRGGAGGAAAPGPECMTASDCKLVSDCCSCEAIPVGDTTPTCALVCIQSQCDARQLPRGAVACVAGRCVAGFACDSSQVTCRMAPPTCPTGEVPTINDAGNCYTGACAPATECTMLANCIGCTAADRSCVNYQTQRGSQFHCVSLPAACSSGRATCACLGPSACIAPYRSCGDTSGLSGITCSCPNC